MTFRADDARELPPGALDEIDRVAVLLVFWRESGRWRVRHFEVDDVRKARRFAVSQRTVVVASYVGVPRVASLGASPPLRVVDPPPPPQQP